MTEETIVPQDDPPPGRRLVRAGNGRLIAGVCGGLGAWTGIDPVIFRVVFAVLALSQGQGILLYIAAALLMAPDDGRPAPAENLFKRRFDGEAVLAILATLLGVSMMWSLAGGLAGLVLSGPVTAFTVLALALLVAQHRGVNLLHELRGLPQRFQGHPQEPGLGPQAGRSRTEPLAEGMIDLAGLSGTPSTPYEPGARERAAYEPAFGPGEWPEYHPYQPKRTPRPRSALFRIVFPLALLAGAVTVPFTSRHPWDVRTEIALATALAIVALGLFIGAWRGRTGGLMAIGTLLSLSLITTSAVGDLTPGGRVGHVIWRPVDVTTSEQTYKLTAGDARLDLTALRLRPGQRIQVRAELGIGQLLITVPRAARVELNATVTLGDLSVDQQTIGGPRVRVTRILLPEVPQKQPPVIELTVRGRAGDVEVNRA
ncbi:MAG: phage shock protein PspC [Actinomycetia bacterium]|nr:phage shock protein PspC [Actinomycetes bacterium]